MDQSAIGGQSSQSTTPYSVQGLLGANQVVAIADTGVDISSCYFSDPSGKFVTPSDIFSPKTDTSMRKVVQYTYCMNKQCNSDTSDPPNGHGTHVSGTAVGSIFGADLSSSKFIDCVTCKQSYIHTFVIYRNRWHLWRSGPEWKVGFHGSILRWQRNRSARRRCVVRRRIFRGGKSVLLLLGLHLQRPRILCGSWIRYILVQPHGGQSCTYILSILLGRNNSILFCRKQRRCSPRETTVTTVRALSVSKAVRRTS